MENKKWIKKISVRKNRPGTEVLKYDLNIPLEIIKGMNVDKNNREVIIEKIDNGFVVKKY